MKTGYGRTQMKIGITYDTIEDYADIDYSKFCDFATLGSISFLKKQFEFAGYEVDLIGSSEKLKLRLKENTLNVDIIYNTAEGIHSRNREGIVPSLLEAHGIPYIGSDAYSLSLSLNKYHTKILAEFIGVPTPKAEIIYLNDSREEICRKVSNLSFPLIIKPNYEGSSMGLYLTETIDSCFNAIEKNQMDYKQEIICEEYIEGMEITVPIIEKGHQIIALAVIQFNYNDGKDIALFTSDDKHYADIRCCDANITETTRKKVVKYAKNLHKLLGCRDINRVDFRIDSDQNIFFLEMTPIPALGPDGSFVYGAKACNMTFPGLLYEIVQNALDRANISTSVDYISQNNR